MKLYAVTNMYMSGIHAGIQCQHSTVEMFLKYKDNPERMSTLFDYAQNHKTTVVLNGGMDCDMQKFLKNLEYWDLNGDAFEFAPFYEPGIGNALTSISVLVPDTAVITMQDLRKYQQYQQESKEIAYDIFVEYGRGATEVLSTLAFLPTMK